MITQKQPITKIKKIQNTKYKIKNSVMLWVSKFDLNLYLHPRDMRNNHNFEGNSSMLLAEK